MITIKMNLKCDKCPEGVVAVVRKQKVRSTSVNISKCNKCKCSYGRVAIQDLKFISSVSC